MKSIKYFLVSFHFIFLSYISACCAQIEESNIFTIGSSLRPAELIMPTFYNKNKKLPIVVTLHGYSRNKNYFPALFAGVESVERNQHILINPVGTRNPDGIYFWNSVYDGCCDFYYQEPDDVSYISSLVRQAIELHNGDPSRVMVVGHSNGGFMAHRLACETGNLFHTVVNIAGASYDDFSLCKATGYPNILNIHGTVDEIINFQGGITTTGGRPYPASEETILNWARRSGCEDEVTMVANYDYFSPVFDGEEQYETKDLEHRNCGEGNRVALWRVDGGDHSLSTSNVSMTSEAFHWAFKEPKENIVSVATLAPVFLSTSNTQSYIRLINSTDTDGKVKFSIRKDSGEDLGECEFSVGKNTAPQYDMKAIENSCGIIPDKSGTPTLNITATSTFQGSIQHVIWNPTGDILTNFSTCTPSAEVSNYLTNVHSTNISKYASYIAVINGEDDAKTIKLDIADSATGIKIDTWTSPSISEGGHYFSSVSKIESEIGFIPDSGQVHYTITLTDTAQKATIMHFIDNMGAGALTEFNGRCALNKSSF